jgi:uncharacterized protein with ParB-like and HNH nuclease domain
MANDEVDIEDLEEENEVYSAEYKINTYGADYTIEILSKKLENKEIMIPSFQRKFVWDIKKASKLIESFLLGLPVPQIFLYREEETQNLLVIDGQQRLKSVNYFLEGIWENGNAFRLKGVLSKWENKLFKDLSESEKRKLNNSVLRASVFEQTAPEDNNSSMFQIFERLNSGGVILTQQEIRNCIYHGKIVKFLNQLNEYKPWREILNKDLPDRRAKDVELILRMLSLSDDWGSYDKPMRDFMNKWMKKKRNLSQGEQDKYKSLFHNIVDVVSNELGSKAFRPVRSVSPPVVDSVFVGLANSSNMKEGIKKYSQLMEDEDYLKNIKGATTNVEVVTTRIRRAIDILK